MKNEWTFSHFLIISYYIEYIIYSIVCIKIYTVIIINIIFPNAGLTIANDHRASLLPEHYAVDLIFLHDGWSVVWLMESYY